MADSGMQASQVTATKNGIGALETAFRRIYAIRQEVESTRQGLGSHYQGSDGKQFGDLVSAWEGQCDIILKNLEGMVDQLNNTLASQHQLQGSSNDQINEAYRQAKSVFDVLQG